MPPSKRKSLVAKLDRLFSLWIKLRDKKKHGVCLICKRKPIEVCYHLIPRGRYATRWDDSASCGACTSCNFGEMMNRLLYRQKHIEIFGKDFYEALEQKALTIPKFGIMDLEAMKNDLEKKIGGLNG